MFVGFKRDDRLLLDHEEDEIKQGFFAGTTERPYSILQIPQIARSRGFMG